MSTTLADKLLTDCHKIAKSRELLSSVDQVVLDELIDKLDDQHPVSQSEIDWINERL